LEKVLVFAFLLRIIQSPINNFKNGVVIIFALITAINMMIYWLFPTFPKFNIFHITSSSLFIAALGPFEKENSKIKVIFGGVLSILFWVFCDTLITKIGYVLSIYYLVHTGIKKTKSNSKNLDISIIYILLAFDQLTTFIIQSMREINTNWHQSIYLKYFAILPIIIFPLTFILIHAKFRRLFSN
jgi:hypothetical protein